MKRLLATIRTSVLTALFSLLVFAAPVTAFASSPTDVVAITSSSKQNVCDGAGLSAAECNGSSTGLSGVVAGILRILSIIVGVAAVIMIIVSGFRYITSGGDAAKVSAAKNALIYALIGLVVVALARVIVHFVLAKTA